MAHLSIRWRLLIVFTLLFTIAFALSFLWFYNFATALAMDNLRSDLIGTAITAASAIDLDEHTMVFEAGKEDDPDYTRIADILRQVQAANPKVAAIYTMVRSDNLNELLFVVSADENPETRAGLREPYDVSEFPQMFDAFNGPAADPKITMDKWGAWFSGYAPIVDAEGRGAAIVGIDMIAQDVIDVQTRIKRTSILAFTLVYLGLFVAVFFISFTVTRPLRHIIGAAQALERGDRYRPEELAPVARGSDEIGQLARVFGEMALEVQDREDKLKQQVVALRIEIDEAQKQQQVAEVTETDYFRELQAHAAKMRNRAKGKQRGDKG